MRGKDRSKGEDEAVDAAVAEMLGSEVVEFA